MNCNNFFTYCVRSFISVLCCLSLIVMSNGCSSVDVRNDIVSITISTEKDLMQLADEVAQGKYMLNDSVTATLNVKLLNDLDMTGYIFHPIGIEACPFKGTFDGGGHIIEYLKVYPGMDSSRVGMFGYVIDSEISNLTLESADVEGSTNVGILCGYCYNTTLKECIVSGYVFGYSYVGGVAGEMSYSYITDCRFAGVIEADNFSIGGIVGSLEYGNVLRCNSEGEIYGGCEVGEVLGTSNECSVLESESSATLYVSGKKDNEYTDKLSRLLFSSAL